MKRAAEEKPRTENVWRRHLWMHRGTVACVCEFQVGRFRKSQRVGGCGQSRCWLCHSGKLSGEPTIRERRSLATFTEGLMETSSLSNNSLQRTCDRRGRPVLAMDGVLAGAEWAACLAAELGR
jgi:hypothetical protein